jgi:hypothetical protein
MQRQMNTRVLAGILPEKESLAMLGATLVHLTANDKQTHSNVAIITAFCKYCGPDFMGTYGFAVRTAATAKV